MFRILRMFLNGRPQPFNVVLIVVQTVAQVFFHFGNFGLFGEQIQQIFNFEHIELSDDLEGFLHANFLLHSFLAG